VERVEAEQLAGTLRLDVTRLSMPQAPEHLPRALGQETGVARTVVLEHEQALPPGSQPVPAQQALYRARGHPQPPQPLRVRRQPLRAPSRFGDRDGEQPPLDVVGQLRLDSGSRRTATRMQAVDPIAAEAMLPSVEQRAGDPCLGAGPAHPDLRRTTNDLQPHPLYALVEVIGPPVQKWVPWSVSTLGQMGQ